MAEVLIQKDKQLLDKSVLETGEMILNMGPQHPSTHGVLRLKIHTDGEVVSKIEPVLGYLHRCFEKHSENLPYEQIVPFTDRCDYLASMHMNHAFSITVEKLLDLELPDRVEYIRVLVSELQRIASHLLAVGTFGLDVGAITPFTWTLRDRERILDLFEQLCGARLLYNYIWPGGVSHDLPPNFIEHTIDFVDYFEPNIDELNDVLTTNKIFIERSADVGILPAEVGINFGVSGPSLRGSGVNWDLRKNEPYSVYEKFDLVVSNPPYLLKNEMKTLMPEVTYEPKESLYDNKDGLSFYKRILPEINLLLSENSHIYFEINPENLESIEKICKNNNFYDFRYINDLSGKKRFVLIKN